MQLQKRFSVHTLPQLVSLDPSGSVINSQARINVEKDPEAQKFPWPPLRLDDLLAIPLKTEGGKTVEGAMALKGKTIALYFSGQLGPGGNGGPFPFPLMHAHTLLEHTHAWGR